MNAPFDAEFKASTREEWDKHANRRNDHSVQLGDWLHESTDAMLETVDVGAGMRVLDCRRRRTLLARCVFTVGALALSAAPVLAHLIHEGAHLKLADIA
jgi:hypothetical protein